MKKTIVPLMLAMLVGAAPAQATRSPTARDRNSRKK